MFALTLVVVGVVPFALIGIIRFLSWAAPAQFRWAERLEREHHRAYWFVMAATYLFIGVGFFLISRPDRVLGVAFVAMGVVSTVKAARGRSDAPTTPVL